MTDDHLYTRFDKLREDLMSPSTADPSALRQAARHRTRMNTLAAAAVTAVGAIVAAAVAFGAPQAPQPGASTGPTTPIPSMGPTGSPAPSATPTCRAFTLSHYGGDGHAGSATNGYAVTNTGSIACELTGFAGLTFVDQAGRPLPTTIVHSGTETRLVLAPGGVAYFEVTTVNVPVDNEGAPCDPPAAGLLIFLPNSGETVNLPGTYRACGQGRATMTPFHESPDPNMHQ